MKAWFTHHHDADLARLDDELTGMATPLKLADRACCCPARPAVTVIMPPAPGRPHQVELLLCGHHYRASRAALRAVGATVYDEAGLPIMTADPGQRAGHGEPAVATDGRSRR